MAIRLAVSARTAVCLGALTFFDRLPFFDDNHLFVATASDEFDCRKNTRWTCADYTNIVLFHTTLVRIQSC